MNTSIVRQVERPVQDKEFLKILMSVSDNTQHNLYNDLVKREQFFNSLESK